MDKTDHINEIKADGYTFRFQNIFHDNVTLEQILAARVLQTLSKHSPNNRKET